MTSNLNKVTTIVDSYNGSRNSLISILHDVQSEYNYLPEDAVREVVVRLGLPLIQVYGVATFLKSFNLERQVKMPMSQYRKHL